VFRTLWEEMGGTLAGTVRDGPVPPNARLLATQESPPLTEVVRDINKFSNNVMARQLFLTLSAEMLKLPAAPTVPRAPFRPGFRRRASSSPSS